MFDQGEKKLTFESVFSLLSLFFYLFSYNHHSFISSSDRVASHECEIALILVRKLMIVVLNILRSNNLSFNHFVCCLLPIPNYIKFLSSFEFWNISKDYSVFVFLPPFTRSVSKDEGIPLIPWYCSGWLFHDSFSQFFIKVFLRKVNYTTCLGINQWSIDI